jgi:hypothetical protein
LDNVTVQVALLLEPKIAGEHCKEFTVTAVCRETVVEEKDPFSDAVRVAD